MLFEISESQTPNVLENALSQIFDNLKVRNLKFRNSQILESWSLGVLEFWNLGIVESWNLGLLKL